MEYMVLGTLMNIYFLALGRAVAHVVCLGMLVLRNVESLAQRGSCLRAANARAGSLPNPFASHSWAEAHEP